MSDIRFSNISVPVKVVLGLFPVILSAIIAFTTVRIHGQQTQRDLDSLRIEVKDTIRKSQQDHDKIIEIDTNTKRIMERQQEFKSDIREIKELILRQNP